MEDNAKRINVRRLTETETETAYEISTDITYLVVLVALSFSLHTP